MTNEEVISELEDIMYNALDFVDERTKRAFDMAIEALKNKIPQKPRIVYCPNSVSKVQNFPYCPSCDTYIEYGFQRLIKYCPYCGQAIDWLG